MSDLSARGPSPYDRPPESDIDDELTAHFEGTVELLMQRGWDEDGARAEARRRFGDVDRHRRTLRGLARRRARRTHMRSAIEATRVSLVRALRSLRASPGMSAAVVVTLLLGIGINGAIFRVVDQLLLSPPPHITEPDQVVRLYQTVRRGDAEPRTWDRFSYRDLDALRTGGSGATFAGAGYYVPETLGAGENATRVRIARVDSAYFRLVGVEALFGRRLTEDDHEPGAAPVAVLGHSVWVAHFGKDPDVVGRTIELARGRYTVVGVLPRGFVGAQAPAADVWIPLESDAETRWGVGWRSDPNVMAISVLARLRPGIRREQWRQREETLLRQTRADDSEPLTLVGLSTSSLVPGESPEPGSVVSVSRWVAGVALLVLIIACANVANLFLAQDERDRHASAVRSALGASPARLRFELLVRSAMLASLAAIGAMGAAAWGADVLEGLFLTSLELPLRVGSGRTLVFVGVTALASSFVAGVIPALRLRSAQLRGDLTARGRNAGGRSRVRRALVVVQVALSTVLLIGAGLFVQSLRKALAVDLGFDAEQVLYLSVEKDTGVDTPRPELYRVAADRLRLLPGVESVSPTIAVPFQLLYGLAAGLPGRPPVPGTISVNGVGADYFRTLGLPIQRGRPIVPSDLAPDAEPVVVVGSTAAQHLWPDADPLGRCLRVGDDEASEGVCTRVVGIAREHAGASWTTSPLAEPVAMLAWVPLTHPEAQSPSSLLVRLDARTRNTMDAVREAAVVPGVRYVEVEPLARIVDREVRSWKLGASVLSGLAGVALLVAVLGLYAVLSFEVVQRRREFGIRKALGGDRLQVMAPAIVAALPMVLLGLAFGAAIAAVGSDRLSALLFATSPRDPSIFAGALGVLLLFTALALIVPAWRAGSADPRETLAEE